MMASGAPRLVEGTVVASCPSRLFMHSEPRVLEQWWPPWSLLGVSSKRRAPGRVSTSRLECEGGAGPHPLIGEDTETQTGMVWGGSQPSLQARSLLPGKECVGAEQSQEGPLFLPHPCTPESQQHRPSNPSLR